MIFSFIRAPLSGKLRGVREKLKRWAGSRYGHAAGAGALLALAFPKPEIAGLAWLAPGLLLLASASASGGKSFRIGYVGGLVFWGITLHWLLLIPVAFAPILGWLALSAYLALYQGAWTWACWRLFPRPRPADADLAGQLLATGRWSRAGWALACAALWVALEMVRARLLTGFPWSLLGGSQATILPLVQLASVTGVYGISFVVAWGSVALVLTGLLVTRQPARRHLLWGELLAPALALTGVWLWGVSELWRKIEAPPGPSLKVALIQPAVPQTLIWDSREDDYRFRKLLALSRAALTNHPDLLIWPEAAVPGMLRYDTNIFQAVTNLAVTHRVWMIIGSDDAEPDATDRPRYLNSAFLVSPTGELLDRYSKRHLVIFGEYVPLAKWLPFLKKLTPVNEGFAPGSAPGQFRFQVGLSNDIPVQAGLSICFEDVFPELARDSVESGTDFLLNLTNDGWFKESAAQYQHAANAVFRAVETGRPLVRCTNNGRSCWVDAAGRLRPMQEFFAGEKQDIYAESFRIAQVPLTSAKAPLTFYHRHGDWFGWSCMGAVGILALAMRRRAN